MNDYSRQGIPFNVPPPEPLPEGFHWGRLKQVDPDSKLAKQPYRCAGCPKKIRVG